MTRFGQAEALLRGAVEDHAFPAASVEVGRADGVLWRAAFGAFTFDPYAPLVTPETIFDLASLTKVMATTTLVMRAVDDGRLGLDEAVAARIRGWRGADREGVAIRDLLAHRSGLPALLPLYRDRAGRAEFEEAICAVPLEYAPRTASVYSDLGFILLGFILEDAAPPAPDFRGAPGAFDPSAALAEQFRHVAAYLTPEPLAYCPARGWRSRCAPTGADGWRDRLLQGEVHDDNCWALGGASGHAGVFGTSAAVGAFARAALRTMAGEPILARPVTMREFCRRTGVPGSSRALGWDTMLPTSSCGTRLSPTAIGHTGFTGTSLWIDRERDLYIVLLTNRVHPTRANEAIRGIRPRFHEAVVEAVDDGNRRSPFSAARRLDA